MKQPDLRSMRGGRAGEARFRRREYSEFREEQVHFARRDAEEERELENELIEGSVASEEVTWVSTPTAERVIAGLRYAQFTRDIVVIYGGAGLGKSHCVRHYRRITPSVFHVELSPATGSLTASLQEVCRVLDLRIYSKQVAYMHRSICTRLRGSSALLVIDEAQELNMQALDQVRCIHDQAKIGIALVGNEQVYAQIAGANRAAYLDRLYSRIGKRIHLPRAVPGDAVALIDAWGIAEPNCRARLAQIGGRPGALRVLGKVVRLAGVYAQGEGREIGLEDVDCAWADLGGIG